MATDQDPPEDQDPPDQDPPEDGKDKPEDQDPPEDDPKDQKDPKDQDPEKAKLIQARDRLKAKTRDQETRIRELEEKLNPGKADPVKAANRKLVTAEARVVLTKAGVADAGDQKAVMDFLGLDSVAVSDDGDVDAEEIQERLDTLQRVFGKAAGGGTRRTPRTDTRDRGGEKAKEPDAASKRRRAMLGY